MPIERRDLDHALKKKGFAEAGDGDHAYYWLHVDGKATAIHTKVSRGTNYKTLGDDIVSKIARQMKIKRTQLIAFVDCSLTEKDYVAGLRANKALP